jgi:pimeloyl-[acyl-carrier protein] synthase
MGSIQFALWSFRKFDRWRAGNPPMRSDEEFRLDPYESYDRIRQRGQIIRSYANQGWLVNGFEEVQALLLDNRLSSDIRRNKFFYRLLRVASNGNDIPLIDKPAMLNRDPPDHTRLRKLVASGFVTSYINSLEPMIESLIDELLDEVSGQGEFDLISTLAQPLPAMVIAEMMGVPVAERQQFQRWSETILGATMIDQPKMIEAAAIADKEMRSYLEGLVEEKEKSPGQDFISVLLESELESDRLTRDELISNCILLMTAGHETTTRLIGNGLYTLLHHPDQLQLLRDDPSLMKVAVEEMLRYESPIQITVRFVAENFEFKGASFKKNQMVMLGLGAANRDPNAMDRPEVFDIRRSRVSHVSFGYGIHLCLGMVLARLEGRIALRKLLERFDEIQSMEESPSWGNNPFFRGLANLRIKVS